VGINILRLPNLALIFGGTVTSFGSYGFSSFSRQRVLLLKVGLIF